MDNPPPPSPLKYLSYGPGTQNLSRQWYSKSNGFRVRLDRTNLNKLTAIVKVVLKPVKGYSTYAIMVEFR